VKRTALLGAALVAAIAMTALLGWRWDATRAAPDMRAYSASFDHPTTHAERLIDGMDGQAFGEIALDPAMTHAARQFGSKPDAAYREARPVYGWVTYGASLGGDAAQVANTLLVLSVLSVALLAAAAGAFARRIGRPALSGALVVLVPGAAITVFAPGSADAFGAAVAFAGLAWWLRTRHRGAIALFCIAGLTRETLLVVPVALAAYELWSHRSRVARILLVPVVVYAAWIAVVYARVGALPTDARTGRLGIPFLGLAHAMVHWSTTSQEIALGLLVLTVVAAVRVHESALRLLVAANVALASVLGPLVWTSWRDFSRVLLPVAVIGVLACWPAAQAVAERDDHGVDDNAPGAIPSKSASALAIALPTASGA
jgi:hypothetical protein